MHAATAAPEAAAAAAAAAAAPAPAPAAAAAAAPEAAAAAAAAPAAAAAAPAALPKAEPAHAPAEQQDGGGGGDACWAAVPAPIMAPVLAAVPWKAGEMRAVCRAWRAAVNASLDSVALPAADLSLLAQLPHVRHLQVHAGTASSSASSRSAAASWPPSSAAGGAGSGGRRAEAGEPSSGCSWSAVPRKTWRQLLSLRLVRCPALAQLLAATVAGPVSGVPALQLLQLHAAGPVSGVLLALLPHGGGPNSQAHEHEQLQQLLATDCAVEQPHAAALPALAGLPGLRLLELSGSGLEQLPAAVCGCGALEQLLLRRNSLSELPEALGGLTRLQVLDVSDNPTLRRLGAGVAALAGSLQELRLAGSWGLWLDWGAQPQQQHQPAAAADCSDDAAGSAGSSSRVGAAARAALPPVLPPLSHQRQLQLLPELAALSRLTKLDVSSNRSQLQLPASLARLQQLRVLDARGCGLRWLGDELWACTGLHSLLLADNVLVELPEDVGRLRALQVLDLAQCASLWRLPGALLNLQQLQQLRVSSKAVGQHVLEQLELRPTPVDVVLEPDSEDEAGEGWASEQEGDASSDE